MIARYEFIFCPVLQRFINFVCMAVKPHSRKEENLPQRHREEEISQRKNFSFCESKKKNTPPRNAAKTFNPSLENSYVEI